MIIQTLAVLAITVNSLELKCYFLNFQYSFFDEHYTCKSHGFSATANNRVVKSVSGNHLLRLTNQNVQQIYIRGQVCEVIPRGFSKFFPNITSLSMPHTSLQYLFNDDLSDLKNLRSIDFAYSKFMKVDSNFFAQSRRLEIISFRKCHELKMFGHAVFKPLKNLRILQLTELKCINEEALNNKTAIQQLVERVKINCQDPDEEQEDATEEAIESTTQDDVTRTFELRIKLLETELIKSQDTIKTLTRKLRVCEASAKNCEC